jgi:hypothetical protein
MGRATVISVDPAETPAPALQIVLACDLVTLLMMAPLALLAWRRLPLNTTCAARNPIPSHRALGRKEV